MKSMAATAPASAPVPAAPVATAPAPVALNRRRRIDPRAGHALEKLGHAIEYLTDEFVHEGGSLSGSDPRVTAVQLLMALNREIYFDCPVVPTYAELWHSFWRRRTARNRPESLR